MFVEIQHNNSIEGKGFKGVDINVVNVAYIIATRVYNARKKRMMMLESLRSCERQNILYAQGRTAPGAIVTYAQCLSPTTGGAHQYNCAVDMWFLDEKGNVNWNENAGGVADWYYNIAKQTIDEWNALHTDPKQKVGWGGLWLDKNGNPKQDRPHIQLENYREVGRGSFKIQPYNGNINSLKYCLNKQGKIVSCRSSNIKHKVIRIAKILAIGGLTIGGSYLIYEAIKNHLKQKKSTKKA